MERLRERGGEEKNVFDLRRFLAEGGVRACTQKLVLAALLTMAATVPASGQAAGVGYGERRQPARCGRLSDFSLVCFPWEDLGAHTVYSTTAGQEVLFPDGQKQVGWSFLRRTPGQDQQCRERPNNARFAFSGGARRCPKGVAPTD
jgi:hypothetical protein